MGFKRLILAASASVIAALAAGQTAFAVNGPKDKAIGFQEGVTPVMENLVSFHNVYLMPIITGITLFVLVLMGYIMWRFSEKRNPVPSKTTHHVGLEVAWTIVPVLILLDTTVRVIVTSSNNLHSFAVPAFGIKMDAVPGRLNETWFKVNPGKEGTYFGQCSELCGVRHAYMPIEVQVVSKAEFSRWAANGGAFTTSTASIAPTATKIETQISDVAGAATAAAPK